MNASACKHLITIPRTMIELGDCSQLLDVFGAHEKSQITWSCGWQQYVLQVSGYDLDPRELAQIPEVVDFFRAWDNVSLTWSYFVCGEEPHRWLFACLFGKNAMLADGTVYWSTDHDRFLYWARGQYLAIYERMMILGFDHQAVEHTLEQLAHQHRSLFVVEN